MQRKNSRLVFNNVAATHTTFQKHLGVISYSRLTLDDHLNNVLSQINKTIGLLRKWQNTLSRSVLMLSIYKGFVRPHLDFDDILYDEAYNIFHQKLERAQYNTCLSVTTGNLWQFKRETLPRIRLRVYRK